VDLRRKHPPNPALRELFPVIGDKTKRYHRIESGV
jgi:hypothetical protein